MGSEILRVKDYELFSDFCDPNLFERVDEAFHLMKDTDALTGKERISPDGFYEDENNGLYLFEHFSVPSRELTEEESIYYNNKGKKRTGSMKARAKEVLESNNDTKIWLKGQLAFEFLMDAIRKICNRHYTSIGTYQNNLLRHELIKRYYENSKIIYILEFEDNYLDWNDSQKELPLDITDNKTDIEWGVYKEFDRYIINILKTKEFKEYFETLSRLDYIIVIFKNYGFVIQVNKLNPIISIPEMEEVRYYREIHAGHMDKFSVEDVVSITLIKGETGETKEIRG